jgi:hypothetical protein
MAGAHFDGMTASQLPVDPSLSAAAMEQADRKSLRPEPLPTGSWFFSITNLQF